MKYKIVTYGCQMNVHESEKIGGLLEAEGYIKTPNDCDADVIVFNTCCIRENAENRAFGNIGALKKLKRENKNLKIAVVGCMTQQHEFAKNLQAKLPFIDIILGTHNAYKIIDYLRLENKVLSIEDEYSICESVPISRDSSVCSFVNIMYGCNNFCTYCIVPYVRGRERSRSVDSIFNEVKKLVDKGYKEITLLGQNVNSYYDGEHNFAYLLEKLAQIEGKYRLRFMTNHPKDLTVAVVDTMSKYENITKYIHLPIQSGSDNVLNAMNRKYTVDDYKQKLQMLRKAMPNIAITTDIMVGFPNESDADFENTLELVKYARFTNAFMFVYSSRKGTVAEKMDGHISDKVKKSRITKLVKLQNSITAEISSFYIGRVVEVLVEGLDEKTNTLYGRTDCNKMVNFVGDKSLIGKFVDVKITQAHGASLVGVEFFTV